MIAIQVGQELIRAAEVLDSCPIGFGRSGMSIEAGFLDCIAVLPISGCLQNVGPIPGMIGDVAGLVFIESRGAGIPFRRGGNAIDEHVMVENALHGCYNEFPVFLFPGIEVENRRQL